MIEQTVEVPASHKLTIDVPREIPAGPVIIAFRTAAVQNIYKTKHKHGTPFIDRLKEVRQLLKKEMTQNGTAAVPAISGDGWEAHIQERYAES